MQSSDKQEIFKVFSYLNEVGERTIFGLEGASDGVVLSSMATASIMLLIFDAFINAVDEEYQTEEEQNVLRFFARNIEERYRLIEK